MLDIHFDDLAQFVFCGNAALQRHFAMSIDGIETTKDLFFFLLDLFCKGIVLLHGSPEDRTVDVTQLNSEQLGRVIHCMSLGGIAVSLKTSHLQDQFQDENQRHQNQVLTGINMPELVALPDDAQLSDFVFKLRVDGIEYAIKFALFSHELQQQQACRS
jgi:hypothetical protein